MDSIVKLPDSFENLFLLFAGCFTSASFRYFKAIVGAIILGRRRRTLTEALKLFDIQGHFTNIHRFLSRYRWDAFAVGLVLLDYAVDLLIKDGPLSIAIDDSLVKKYGRKIFGVKYHFDHAKKPNTSRYIFGHNWVVFGLIHYSTLFHKWLCLPFFAVLFAPRNKGANGPENNRIDLTIDVLGRIKMFLKRRFILVVDALYAKRRLIRFCIQNKITMISRLQSNAALYCPLVCTRNGKRGRPRKYGPRMSSLAEMAKDRKGYRNYSVLFYRKQKTLAVKTIEALWKPAGKVVRVLIVRFRENNTVRYSYFFCTDLELSVLEIIERVCGRWSIEQVFFDLKEHLGLSHWQCRKKQAVRRSATLNCVALSMLTLWCYLETSQTQCELWDRLPWYTHKSTVSVLDMIRLLREKSISQSIFCIIRGSPINAKNINDINALLKRAA